jgi:hypothetical protein
VSDARSTLYQDLFGLDGLLTEEEREVRERVRAFSDAEVIPIMADCWERGEFPFQLVPKLAALSICGDTIKGYGCAGLSAVGAGLAAMELARGDGSIYTFFGATSGFAINTIFNLGSEDQKEKWIPGMARLEKLGAFAPTEPEHGSDAVMIVRARRSGNILRRLPRRAGCRLRVGRPYAHNQGRWQRVPLQDRRQSPGWHPGLRVQPQRFSDRRGFGRPYAKNLGCYGLHFLSAQVYGTRFHAPTMFRNPTLIERKYPSLEE